MVTDTMAQAIAALQRRLDEIAAITPGDDEHLAYLDGKSDGLRDAISIIQIADAS